MSFRRLLPLLVLIALALAPFGRMGAAQAEATPYHATAMAAHCAGQPIPGDDESAPASIDCMIACAAITAPAATAPSPLLLPALAAMAAALPEPLGILLLAEPPPPRLA